MTCLGVVSQQQTHKANQEIVFHFNDVQPSSNEAQSTIQIVKIKLQELGVENINISNQDEDKLKITYYSRADIASVKEVLFNEMKLNLDFAFKPNKTNGDHSSNSNEVDFDLDIYEIQNTHQSNSGFDNCVLVKKSEIDRYYDPNSWFTFFGLQLNNDCDNQKVAFRIWCYVENTISNPSYVFPEVRAGPAHFGNS